jgi:hypothetical protein
LSSPPSLLISTSCLLPLPPPLVTLRLHLRLSFSSFCLFYWSPWCFPKQQAHIYSAKAKGIGQGQLQGRQGHAFSLVPHQVKVPLGCFWIRAVCVCKYMYIYMCVFLYMYIFESHSKFSPSPCRKRHTHTHTHNHHQFLLTCPDLLLLVPPYLVRKGQ